MCEPCNLCTVPMAWLWGVVTWGICVSSGQTRPSEHIHSSAPYNNNKRTLCRTTRQRCGDRCEARAAREAARLAEAAAAATTVLDESAMLLRHHRGRIGTLRFTSLRRGGRGQRFSMQLATWRGHA